MAEKAVWGLDIGSSAIKVVRIVRSGDEVKIDQFDIVDIPPGEEEKERPNRVRTAMAGLVQSRRFGNDPVYVAVPGNICLHREFQLPPGSEDKLGDLVQYEAKQQIPFPLEQVEWGFERYDDPNGVGVALIAVRKNDIQDLLALGESFKLNVRGIVPSPISLFNFVKYEFRPDSTTLILDAGAKGIDFVVMNGRQFYFRTIQIAGREITRSLENKFKVPFDKAEELKKNVAKSPQMDKIMQVIEPTLRQLGAEVQRTIGFYKAKARGQRISQCYLLGHTFRLPKMAEYLQGQIREAPFALVEGLQRVKLDFSINANVWNNEFPTLAVAIGAGLQGLGLTDLSLNLLPATKVAEQARAGWKAWVAAAAALVLVALGFSYVQAEKAKVRFLERSQSLQTIKQDVEKPKAAEQKAVESMAGKVELLERYARFGRDAGRINEIFGRVAGVRGADGKPFFGPETKAHLTGLYVSRIPFGTDGGLAIAAERNMIKDYDHIKGGKTSYYAPLAKGADPQTIAPELRPDVPLVAVLTGEVEVEPGQSALPTIDKLKDILSNKEKFPEVQDLRLEFIVSGATHIIPPLKYDWSGKAMAVDRSGAAAAAAGTPPAEAGAAVAAKEKKVQNTVFHLMFRWDNPEDKDREPVAVAAPEKSAKGKPGAAKKIKRLAGSEREQATGKETGNGDVKKNLFWLICALVVLVGIVMWGITVPPMWGEAAQAKEDCLKEAGDLVKLAGKAKDPDAILTQTHVKQAEAYAKTLDAQTEAVKAKVAEMKLDVRFPDAPPESSKLDSWLATKRDELKQRAKSAGLELPADFDKLTFKESSTDDRPAADPDRRRDYRLRQMALVEEVVNVLCRKYGKAPVLRFQQEAAATEPQEMADVGVLALERLTIAPTRGASTAKAGAPAPKGGGTSGGAAYAEDRIKAWQHDAFQRSGRSAPVAPKSVSYQELPYDITTVDVQFVAPLAAVPGVAHALESSDRYTGVVTRMDFQRAAPPYPPATEARLAKAEPVPGLNTHYGEGPVRALVTLDLLEYDKAKAERPRETAPAKPAKKGGK